MIDKPRFSISIVSHGHRKLLLMLLEDLARLGRQDFEVILTWNLKSEDTTIDAHAYPFKLSSTINVEPRGFASNHNAAFRRSSGLHFVLLNPDIRIPEDPFDALLDIVQTMPHSICSPLILNGKHEREDSARPFPTPWFLLKKAVAKAVGIRLPIQTVQQSGSLLHPDWIAGMFMLVPRCIYTALGGLSESYFLYYEDVDFCARARLVGVEALVTTRAFAIHDAQRESHRNLRFLGWHAQSAMRFFFSETYLKLMIRRTFKTKN